VKKLPLHRRRRDILRHLRSKDLSAIELAAKLDRRLENVYADLVEMEGERLVDVVVRYDYMKRSTCVWSSYCEVAA